MNLNPKNIKFAVKGMLIRSIKAVKLLFGYKKTIKFLLKKKGVRAAYNFIWVRVFVKETGPAVINPLFSVFPKLAPHPTHIEVEITTKCHLKCAICEQQYWKEKPADMSFNDFKRLINEFPKLKWVGLAGIGSNFLNRDYIKMLEYLKEKNIFVDFVDHFDRTDEATAKKLVELNVDRIEISMDGATKETYENIKVGCNFERTLENISNLIKIKREMNSPFPELMFRFIITKQNVNEAPSFIEIVRKMKDLGPLSESGKHELEFAGLLAFEGNKDYALEKFPQDIKEKIMEQAKKHNISVSFAHQNPELKRPRHVCAAWVEPFILVDGEVMACCAQNENNSREEQRKRSLGNALKTPFKEIWRSKKYKNLRKNVPNYKAPCPEWCEGCRVTKIN